MAMYDFQCEKGHAFEARVPMGAMATGCPEHGGIAVRLLVPAGFAHTRGLPTDATPPADFYRLNREALDAKHEAMKEKQVAVANGWKPKEN